MSAPIKRVAVIGAGPAGAIAVDALAQEKTFSLIRGFERREGPGGCWIGDASPPPPLSNFAALGDRTADKAVTIPASLPTSTPKLDQPRFTESSIYPYLETNVADEAMAFSQEPIPAERSEWSIATHGPDTPFRPWKTMRAYVKGLLSRRGYEEIFTYNTAVERVEKVGAEWKVTLRKNGKESDYWWVEWFDAVVVASGRYSVPYIPKIDGLEAFEKARPGSVLHSKMYRGRQQFQGKRVVTVGASVSAADIAVDLVGSAQPPVHAVVLGHTINLYFGGDAFEHPNIRKETSIKSVCAETRTVNFVDGSSLADVDYLIFGTGYSWTLPFLPQVRIRNNRVPDLYQHVVWQHDPTLTFVGAVNTGLTFKIFEWQAVYAASVLAGRGKVPPLAEMQRWEAERIKERGDGPKFNLIYPDFEEYFNLLRELSGEGPPGVGRRLPAFKQEWLQAFLGGHEKRKVMWQRNNEAARAGQPDDKRPRL